MGKTQINSLVIPWVSQQQSFEIDIAFGEDPGGGKDFLNSTDRLKEVVYPELPPLDIPGAEQVREGQLELF